jgi:uncharacterized membrane protein
LIFSRALVFAAILWPFVLTASVVARPRDRAWIGVIYAAAGQVCHQRPDRSFSTAGVQWPVCGRCAGLYLAAPLGALLALRRRPRLPSHVPLFVAAAIPTGLTLVVEWMGLAPVSNVMRMGAAVPLGAAIAWMLVRVASETLRTNQVH